MNTERTIIDLGAAVEVTPRLADAVELIGEYQGSGFIEPRYLVRRADGQVIQLSRLLYLLVASLDGQRDLAQLAEVLTAEFGKTVQPEHVSYLIDKRLRPVGIVAPEPQTPDSAKRTAMLVRADPLLGFKFRVAIIPERVVWSIAGLFGPIFWPPVIFAALTAFLTLDALIIAQFGLGQIVPTVVALVYQPMLTLLVLALTLGCAAFHECGHVSACRYGGARPGKMGFGLYLVWPAPYSTVTDSYRLSRAGRLRTDLGGVYFNVVFITGMNLAYLYTQAPWLFVSIVLLHIETAIQFLPIVRLDGYYILADLIGVPDLFSRLGPVLSSAIPGWPTHPRVRELKPWVRRTITLWVLIVVPYIGYWVVGFLILASQVLPLVWYQLLEFSQLVGAAAAAGQIAQATLGVINIILLLLPWAGSSLMLGLIVHVLVKAMVRARVRRRFARSGPRVDNRRLER
jgi:putative peptide zinc metalloprotease protein